MSIGTQEHVTLKILWITDKPIPEVAQQLGLPKTVSQGWLIDLMAQIGQSPGVSLCVASADQVKERATMQLGAVTHYIIPQVSRFQTMRQYAPHWRTIMDAFQPDLVHLHGTEYRHGLAFLRTFPNHAALLTIQGIMTRIEKEYLGNLPWYEVLWNRTLRENLRMGGMAITKCQHKTQARMEREIVRRVHHVTGRTLWDQAVLREINPDVVYYRCNYNLRPAFYDAPKWDIAEVISHSIYTCFANYPLKGLHMLLHAVAVVKKCYPDVCVRVPGMPADADGRLLINSGYKKYLAKLIGRLDLWKNIHFLGAQSAQDVVNEMRHARVVVVPSAMEGASATICEAMYIGTPCICAYRGGMTELLRDGETGFYYDYPEHGYLAERIGQLFADESLARRFSRGLMREASVRHDRQRNVEDMLNVYRSIQKKEEPHES